MMPILLRLGPITIYSFGFFLFLMLLLASFLIWRQARERGLSEEKVLDVLFVSVGVALLFGRLGFVFSHWAFFGADPSRVFLLSKYPGFSLEATVLSGMMAVVLFAVNSQLPWLLVADIFSLAILPSSALGFSGCFLDGCYPDSRVVLTLSFIALVSGLILNFFARRLVSSPELLELSRRPGLFFLTHLIFLSLSFLILKAQVNDRNMAVVYALAAILLVVILFTRYYKLVKYIYGSVSQRRFKENNGVS